MPEDEARMAATKAAAANQAGTTVDKPPPETSEGEPNQILTFEEFTASVGNDRNRRRYGNFFTGFQGGFVAGIFQAQAAYLELEKSKPELVAKLKQGLQALSTVTNSEQLKPFEADMYEAYKFMKEQGANDEKMMMDTSK